MSLRILVLFLHPFDLLPKVKLGRRLDEDEMLSSPQGALKAARGNHAVARHRVFAPDGSGRFPTAYFAGTHRSYP
jgi:hypothetical protein